MALYGSIAIVFSLIISGFTIIPLLIKLQIYSVYEVRLKHVIVQLVQFTFVCIISLIIHNKGFSFMVSI